MCSSTAEDGRVKQEGNQTTMREERRQATLQQRKVDGKLRFRDVRARRMAQLANGHPSQTWLSCDVDVSLFA